MNFVVIDSDSKLRAKLNNENKVKELLEDTECKVYFLEIDKLSENDYKLASLFDLTGYNRIIFIASFTSGVMSYHRKLFVNNKEFIKLTITITDTENDVYQDQIINELNGILAGEKLLYNIILDDSDDFSSTAKECRKAVNTQKRFAVISKNRELAKKATELLAELLPEWQVIMTENPGEETYDDSHMVLLAGVQPEDFAYEPPKSGMGKYLVWCNTDELGYDDASISAIKYSVKESLLDLGWNIRLNNNIFISNIIYEDFLVNVLSGNYTASSLIGNDHFAMWDRFGLPVTNSHQDDAVIREFLDRVCCFTSIAKRV